MNKLLGALIALMFTSQVYAEESSFTLQLPVATYSTSVYEDGSHASGTATGYREMGYVGASFDSYMFYLYPFTPNRMMSVSKLLGQYELGLDLGLNSQDPVTGSKNKSSSLGVFAGTFPQLIPDSLAMEIYLQVDRYTTKDETTSAESAGNLYRLSADFTHPLSKKLTYVGGVYGVVYRDSLYNQTTKTFGVNVMSLRLSF